MLKIGANHQDIFLVHIGKEDWSWDWQYSVCVCVIIRWFWGNSLPEKWKIGQEDFPIRWWHHQAGDRCYCQCRYVNASVLSVVEVICRLVVRHRIKWNKWDIILFHCVSSTRVKSNQRGRKKYMLKNKMKNWEQPSVYLCFDFYTVHKLGSKHLWGQLLLLCFLSVWEGHLQGFILLHTLWSFLQRSVHTMHVNKWTTKGFRIKRMLTVSLESSKGGIT